MVRAVKKPWGEEYLLYQNDDVAIWHLYIDPKQKTSLHSHPNKKTGLVEYLNILLIYYKKNMGSSVSALALKTKLRVLLHIVIILLRLDKHEKN